jgi:Uma2 family endonuclease
MSAEEFRHLAEGLPYFQLIKGELFMPPSFRYWLHQKIVLNIASPIREYLRKHPVGEVVVAPSDVELGPTEVYEPDIYFVAKERIGIFTEQGVTGAPDLVVEVLSPSTAQLDRGPKREGYAVAGVKELWLVEPRQQRIEIYKLRGNDFAHVRTAGVGDTIETPLIPGLTLDVCEIFES